MDLDPQHQRRNLIGLSSALLIYEVGAGEVTNLTLFQGLTISNPETIVALSYFGLVYLTWRYWLYNRASHMEWSSAVLAEVKKMEPVRSAIAARQNEFREESGITKSEEMQKLAIEDSDGAFVPVDFETTLVTNLPAVHVRFSINPVQGGYEVRTKTYAINRIAYLTSVVKSATKLILSDRRFSDLFVPYALAIAAAAFHWCNSGAV